MAKTEAKNDYSLIVSRTLNAPCEKVFKAWTDAKMISNWFAPTEGFIITVSELDVQVGGRYRFEMLSPNGETYIAIGEYVSISPPTQLVFTWNWENSGDSEMLVTIDLTEHDNKTELTLTHERLPNTESRDHHNEGWIGCLENLEKLVGQ